MPRPSCQEFGQAKHTKGLDASSERGAQHVLAIFFFGADGAPQLSNYCNTQAILGKAFFSPQFSLRTYDTYPMGFFTGLPFH